MRSTATFIISVFALISLNAKAQTYGCLTGTPTTGTLYTNTDVLGYYQSGGNQYKTVAPNCPRVQLGVRSGDCYFNILGTRYDRYTYTLITTTTSPIACDLDHYGYGALVVAGFFAVRRMRKIMP